MSTDRADADGFIPVPMRQQRREQRRVPNKSKSENGLADFPRLSILAASGNLTKKEEQYVVPKEDVLRRLMAAVKHMEEDDYFRSFEKVLDQAVLKLNGPTEKIVCYALGTFSCNMIARYQLAFLILLRRKLKVEVEVYDPNFLQSEEELMEDSFGFKVLSVNEEGKRDVCSTQTLFFLPHAPHQLANNLIYSNWNYKSLNKVVMICNSFAGLRENMPARYMSENLGYIVRCEQALEEFGIINTFTYLDIFNDMAIHIFPHYKIGAGLLPNDFWDNSLVPVYKNVDYVEAATLTKCNSSTDNHDRDL